MHKPFYQDFLMDFPYDTNEFPKVEITYINDISHVQEYGTPYNLLDLEHGYIRYLSFQKLHDTLKKEIWDEIFLSISTLDKVILLDDILVSNKEVLEMKEFYLKTYYWNFKQHNINSFVYIDKKQ